MRPLHAWSRLGEARTPEIEPLAQNARFWADWDGTDMEQRGRNRWQTSASPTPEKRRRWRQTLPPAATGCRLDRMVNRRSTRASQSRGLLSEREGVDLSREATSCCCSPGTGTGRNRNPCMPCGSWLDSTRLSEPRAVTPRRADLHGHAREGGLPPGRAIGVTIRRVRVRLADVAAFRDSLPSLLAIREDQ